MIGQYFLDARAFLSARAFPVGQARQGRAGVTLIEAIMVVGLLAAGAITSSFVVGGGWIDRQGNRIAAHDLAETLSSARQTAMLHRTNVGVVRGVSGAMQTVTIVEEPGPMGPGKKWLIEFGSDCKLTGSPQVIWFRPAGTADRALEWVVTQGTSSAAVTVDPISGRINEKLP